MKCKLATYKTLQHNNRKAAYIKINWVKINKEMETLLFNMKSGRRTNEPETD